MIEHTYIELLGFQLADPLTFVSDVLMSMVAFYCGHKMYHSFKDTYGKYIGLFFLFLGMSSLIGGTCHLLDFYFGRTPHLIAWTVQGLSMLFIGLASTNLLDNSKAKNILRFLIYAFFGFFLFQLLQIRHFDVVKVNTTISLIGITSGIHLYKYFTKKQKRYIMVPLSILLFVLPALVHGFNIKINAWINQNVVSHILLLPCYFSLYIACAGIAKEETTSRTQRAPQG